jgi:hypothetical protein
MTAAEFREWQALNELAGSERAARPCADCPAAWQAEREAEGRCNGWPGG